MLAALLTILIVLVVQAQYFSLENNVQPPGPHALATVAKFFLYAKQGGSSKNATQIPPIGWGLWDKKYALPPKIMIHQLAYTLPPQSTADRNSVFLDMAIMEYDTFWNKFVPFQQERHFCCTKGDVARGDCTTEHSLLVPNNIKHSVSVTRVPIIRSHGGSSGGPDLVADRLDAADVEFTIPSTGIYFLMFINCGSDVLHGQMKGAAIARGAHGFLSGMDVPKLQLYAITSMIYASLCVFWAVWCLRFKRQLIVLHHLIGSVIILGFLEQISWLFHLSWANVVSPPSDILLFVCVAISVVKNVSTCALILLASLGYNITRPSLDPNTVAKLWLGCIALAALDSTRQLATHFHVSLDLSILILMLCALPITLLYAGGFCWAFYSLNALIEELKNRRQTAKFRQMNRFRAVLIFASLAFVAATIVETYVLSMDIRHIWKVEWVFTDGVPAGLFAVILTVTAILWRPTRSSKYYSYNLQLPDHELGEPSLDIDRIRADIQGKAFEVTFDSPSTTGVTDHRGAAEIRAWGELDLDMEDDEEVQPVAEKISVKR